MLTHDHFGDLKLTTQASLMTNNGSRSGVTGASRSIHQSLSLRSEILPTIFSSAFLLWARCWRRSIAAVRSLTAARSYADQCNVAEIHEVRSEAKRSGSKKRVWVWSTRRTQGRRWHGSLERVIILHSSLMPITNQIILKNRRGSMAHEQKATVYPSQS